MSANAASPPPMAFTPAVRSRRKLRLALCGPSGSGKTHTALMIARGLVGPGGRIAVCDTENESASLFSHLTTFDILVLKSFLPANYIGAINAAVAGKYDALIIDSLSHAWMGKDGVQDLVDRKTAQSRSGNSFESWRHVTPLHHAMVESIIHASLHIIVTMRAKTEWVVEKNDAGKSVPRKIGLAPVQRDGLEYEFDIYGEMFDATMTIGGKTRCSLFRNTTITEPGMVEGELLAKWLSEGVEPSPAAASASETAGGQTAPASAKKVDPVRTKPSEPGRDQVTVVSVEKFRESPKNARDPWTIWKVVLERQGKQTELTTPSRAIYEAALLAKSLSKPAVCEWACVDGHWNLVACEPVGVPTPVIPADPPKTAKPPSGRTSRVSSEQPTS